MGLRASDVTPGTPTKPPVQRILLVGPSLDILGGQAVQLARLLTHLRGTTGIDVDFLPVNPRLRGPLCALQRVKYVRTIATSVVYIATLFRRVPHYDVVHAFSASYYSYLLAPLPALLAGRLYHKRTLLNYHSGEADDHLANWRSAVPTMRRFADAIVVPSGYLVDVFHRHGLAARAIFNFVDAARLPTRECDEFRPVFFSNRNLEPLYNVRCTLDAFAIVQRDIPDAQLVVAGDGSERNALEKHAHDLDLRNVSFVGRVRPDLMGALYAAADIYLNSSNIDNMPISIIEAYAAGLHDQASLVMAHNIRDAPGVSGNHR